MQKAKLGNTDHHWQWIRPEHLKKDRFFQKWALLEETSSSRNSLEIPMQQKILRQKSLYPEYMWAHAYPHGWPHAPPQEFQYVGVGTGVKTLFGTTGSSSVIVTFLWGRNVSPGKWYRQWGKLYSFLFGLLGIFKPLTKKILLVLLIMKMQAFLCMMLNYYWWVTYKMGVEELRMKGPASPIPDQLFHWLCDQG